MAAPWEENYETAPAAKKPAGSAPPVAVAKPAAAPAVVQSSTPEDFDAEFELGKAAMKKEADKRTLELPKASPLVNEEFLLSPPAMVGLGGAAGAALMYGGSKAAPMVKRWLSGQNAPQGLTLDTLDEPPLFGSPAQRQPFEVAEPPLFSQTPAQPAGEFEPPMSRAPAPSQNLTLEEARARMAGVTPVAPAMAPVVPEAVVPAMTEAPKPVVPSAAPNSAATKSVTDTIQQLGQEEAAVAGAVMPSRPVTPTPTGELRTGAGLPAYAGEGKQYQRMPKEFASVKDVPAGYAFVPGVGPGTNTIRNLETPEGYRAAVQLHGGPFGSHDEAVDFMNKYNAEQRMGPPADRALRKSLGLPLQENTKGIPMKGVKVAGIAGAVMAMSDVANAFNSSVRTGNAGPLMETAFDIGISAIPGVRAAATGLTGSTLQSGKLFKEDRDYSEVLNRPGVRQVLDNMSKIMTPDQFNVEADKYLSKLSSFPQYNSSRFIKPAIGSTQPINRTTLLPIAPPAR
jgi:hypothetical protein